MRRAGYVLLLLAPLVAMLPSGGGAAVKQHLIDGRGDLSLCMAYTEFMEGPGKSFSETRTLGNPLMPPLAKLYRSEKIDSVGPGETTVWFGPGSRLGEVRFRIPPYAGLPQQLPRGKQIYEMLRDQLLQTHAVRPDGPIFVVESELPGNRLLLLIDERGNSISLEHTLGMDEFVQMSYFARGSGTSPGANAARLLLGRDIQFCEAER